MILGIGNILKGDDGIGVYIVEKINKQLKKIKRRSKRSKFSETERVIAINSDTIPENYTSTIREYRPDLLILIDAAEMGIDKEEWFSYSPSNSCLLLIVQTPIKAGV